MTQNKKRKDSSDIGIKILSSLANDVSMKILLACEKGIDRSTKAIEELGLTQKRYYTWLKRLTDAGLGKRGNAYVQTVLGKLSHIFWRAFLKAISQRGHLELADKLMKSDTLSINEKEKLLRVISDKELLGVAGLADVIHEVKMISDCDHLDRSSVRHMDGTKACW